MVSVRSVDACLRPSLKVSINDSSELCVLTNDLAVILFVFFWACSSRIPPSRGVDQVSAPTARIEKQAFVAH